MESTVSYDVAALLATWEETYKRGLLSFWLLLVLAERPTYAYEMNKAIQEVSHSTQTANDQSIYRALTRFEGLGLVTSVSHASPVGPPRKYYHLTPRGRQLLITFARRNLLIFQEPEIVARLQKLTVYHTSEGPV